MLLVEVLGLHIFWSVPLAAVEPWGRLHGDRSEIYSLDTFLVAA